MKKGRHLYYLAILLFSCQLHKLEDDYKPSVEVEKEFSLKGISQDEKFSDVWYKSFNNGELNRLIAKAFANNFNLKQIWSQLRQAEIQAQLAGVTLRPEY